jgi:hypothetical protein
MSSIITAPAGYDAVKGAEHASRALRYLLTTYPNRMISHREVCDVVGFQVCPQAVSNAAARLRSGAFGLHILSRGGIRGGYVLLVPVPASDERRCASCGARSVIGTCRRLKGRPVSPGEWCWAWSQ